MRRLFLGLGLLSVGPSVRPSAGQDTSAIDRGVRIGIIYRPGVRPGLVVLPGPAPALDSVRVIIARDLDLSDRFELITLPGGDSIRVTAASPALPGRPATGGRGGAAAGLNYPLYQALGADFAVGIGVAADTTVLTVHDVAAGGVRREVRTKLPPLKDAGFRMAVHRLADRILEATLGVGGIAATRILFVMDGRVYMIDQDGADRQLVSSSDHQAMSPAWAPDGRRFAYMEFSAGHGQLFVQPLGSGKRQPVVTTGQALDFTPAFSPDGKTLAFSRATEEGTDLPQIYVMAADGTDQQLFAPFDYGVTGSSNAPDWSPDGQSVAFHRDVAGTLQVFVLDVRTRAVRQLTSLGRNEDPTWAPDSRHLAFVSDRSGYRQLWIIDLETGRIRPLLQQSGARLPAWSPRLPETASSTP
ncbi:MAG: hypothetical protein AUG79_03695 [Gemmatimonadetes bacterium 13_1_20CM_4_69_16]|nr:MAG: hypothetical protein AUG79_03695 [Gemmatimonadetes bacterium 13_1_20CM_4_69_16]